MRDLPTIGAEKGVAFTMADFLEAGRERLSLRLLAGRPESLNRVIEEPVMNRTGLALTGFFECFAWKRLHLIGNAESAYMRSLPPEERVNRFKALLDHKAKFFVFTGGHRPEKDIQALLEAEGAVVLSTPLKTRYFARLGSFLLEQLGAPRTSIYGTMIEVSGLGILIEGDPGLGKSETALGLIKRGSALIADDLTCVRKDVATNLLFGSASESTAGYMEIRGIGILHVPSIFGVNAVRGEKRLQLVLTFKRLNEIRGEIDRTGQTRRMRNILGVDVPNILIPVSEGRDLVNLVETAAQQQKLIDAGYDSVAELSEHLRRRTEQPQSEKRKGRTNGR